MSGLIYIARAKLDGCQWLKIGCSKDPYGRMMSVHSPGDAGAEILDVIDPDGFWFTVEKRAHERLAHRHKWREWFEVTRQEALWAVHSADRDHRTWVRSIPRRSRAPMSLPLAARDIEYSRPNGTVVRRTVEIGEFHFQGRHY